MTRDSDVLVLGAGVIGLSCALALLKKGRSVTLLDQGTAGGGASHGNCGTLTPSHLPLAAPGVLMQAAKWMLRPDSPLLIRPTLDPERLAWLLHFAARCNETRFREVLRNKVPLLQQSRQLTEQWIREEHLDCEFEASGTLYVFRDARKFEKAHKPLPWLRELGLTVQSLDGAAVEALEPALKPGVAGGLRNPGDARLRPDRYAAELARVVRERGGAIRQHTPITGFRHEQGRLLAAQTRDGDFRGREVVLALGAWSPLLARQLDLRLPIEAGKGYSITYERPARCPRIPLVLKERGVCVTSWDSGYRLGSTVEFAGHDTTLNRVRLDALRRGAAEYLHEPEGPRITEEWYGWRPMVYDDLPIIGRAPGIDNLWLATGHGMLGVTLAAATGQLIGDMLGGEAPSLDAAPFSPARFA